LHHERGSICIEYNKPEALELLRDKVKDNDKIEVHVMKTKYPQGAERQLIYANTGRYVNSKMLPADAGCIVHNVDTIVSIYEAVIALSYDPFSYKLYAYILLNLLPKKIRPI